LKLLNFLRTDESAPFETMRIPGIDYADEPQQPVIEPPAPRSIVGETVATMNRVLIARLNIAASLEAEISSRQEALRQTRAVIHSVELAMLEMLDDPALTADERSMIEAIQARAIDRAVGAAEAEING
jgi:hypothetical protein